MSFEIKVPEVGESIQEVHIARWLKQEGDEVAEDEDVVELETDKASMELPAPRAGVLSEIRRREGETAAVGDVIALIEEGNGKPKAKEKPETEGEEVNARGEAEESKPGEDEVPRQAATDEPEDEDSPAEDEPESEQPTPHATPSARRELRKNDLTANEVEPAGKRIRPEDVRRHVKETNEQGKQVDSSEPSAEREVETSDNASDSDLEEVVQMSFLRKRIAQRLVEAQQKAALLTTFNEIDMSHLVQVRQEHGEAFQQRYGVKLGFMSFFVKAVIDALMRQPELNAEIRDEDKIVYRHYYHIGIAIGADEGLVVPVLRHAQRLSFAEIEQAIDDFAQRAKRDELQPDELQGGTFTISNGGVYGSLLSTPIVNPPQSGVLGMHAIENRPVAADGEVVIRPMMYVALTYDHRIVDGREAVTFLRRVKEAIEQPARMLVEV